MSYLQFLADENFPMASYQLLVELGYEIEHIIPDYSGLPDDKVIELANRNNQIILTFDSDFGDLIYRDALYPPGLIYFRWNLFTPKEPGHYLHQLLTEGEIEFLGRITVIKRDGIRQRMMSE